MSGPFYIGPALRHCLKQAGLGQTDVARRLGLDDSTINNWCRDIRSVPHYRLDALSEILGVTLDQLMGAAPTSAPVEPRIRQRKYSLSCLAAGHSTNEVIWTEKHAKLEAKAMRFRCAIDGSRMLLSEGDLVMTSAGMADEQDEARAA